MQAGKQIIIQPVFAPYGQKFNKEEVISSIGIVADRSGNESAVKHCKMPDYLCKGLEPAADIDTLAGVWLVYYFKIFLPALIIREDFTQ
eukprot:2636965-Ditylum_brightwellii.AAC.1